MSAMPSPAQSEFSEGSLPVKPSVEAPVIRPADLKNDRSPKRRQSLAARVPLAIARFLITFGVGVATTLAWQSYGDAAREMIASASPQLGWLAPQAASVAQSASDAIEPAATRAVAADPQQLNPVSLDLDAVRQSVDGADGARDQQTAGDRTIHALQELRASAAAGRCPGPCPQAGSAAGADSDSALTDRSVSVTPRHLATSSTRSSSPPPVALMRLDIGQYWQGPHRTSFQEAAASMANDDPVFARVVRGMEQNVAPLA